MALKSTTSLIVDQDGKEYKLRCSRCGKVYDNPQGNFFKSRSESYKANGGYVHICNDCINLIFNDLRVRYQDERKTLKIICYLLDWYYSNDIYTSIIENNSNFSPSLYARRLNQKQCANKTFLTSLFDGSLDRTTVDIYQDREEKWSADEIKRRETVLNVYGYDPFPIEDYSDKDRKYLFANLLEYFDDEIENDAYKRDIIMQLVINNYNISKLNAQRMKLDPIEDAAKIKNISDIISKDIANNDKIAKENEISLKNRSNKEIGKNTFTGLQKELREKDFDKSIVDYYAQLKSEGTQWVLQQSLQAISEHTFFDEADKQELLNTQRELITKQYAEIDNLKEQVRLLHVELQDMRYNAQTTGMEGDTDEIP
jgi:hypothetical protein